MTEISKPSGTSVCVQSIAIVVLAVLLALLGWRVSSYIGFQNDTLNASITSTKQLVEQGRPLDQSLNQFVQALFQYLQATGDPNVVQLMNRYGIPVQLQQAPPQGQGGAATPGTQPATSAPRSTAPAPKTAPSSK